MNWMNGHYENLKTLLSVTIGIRCLSPDSSDRSRWSPLRRTGANPDRHRPVRIPADETKSNDLCEALVCHLLGGDPRAVWR